MLGWGSSYFATSRGTSLFTEMFEQPWVTAIETSSTLSAHGMLEVIFSFFHIRSLYFHTVTKKQNKKPSKIVVSNMNKFSI